MAEDKTLGFVYNNVVWIVDPLNKFPRVPAKNLAEACGLIPTFITEDCHDVVETAIDLYGMCLGGPMGGTVTKDGIYMYPGDPAMFPIAMTTLFNKGMQIFIYQYGIIAFVKIGGDIKVYRFD